MYLTRPKLRYAWLWWAIGWLLIAMTVNDSLERHPPQFLEQIPSDKALHFSGYFALALWFGGVAERSRYLIVGAGLIALGGILELLQGYMAIGRQMELLDFVANTLGVSAGLAISYVGLGMWMVWVERLIKPK